MFNFDAGVFVRPGRETSEGEWNKDDARQIAQLRSVYPELNHWGDLAVGCAFSAFSQDVFQVGWADWLFDARHEVFLDYCCWRQTRGEWTSGPDEDALAKACDWRTGSNE